MKAGVRDIILFGCDGTGGTYYRKEEYDRKEHNQSVHKDSLVGMREDDRPIPLGHIHVLVICLCL